MKSNVCYNLIKTPHTSRYKTLTFHFSSDFNKRRFETRIETIPNEILKINYKLRCNIDTSELFALKFYRDVEQRGFYVLRNGMPLSKTYEAMVIIND